MMRKVKARLPIININLDEHDFFQKFNVFCKYYGIYLISCSVEQNKYSTQCILKYYNLSERPKIYYCMGKYWKNIAPKLDAFEKVYLK